MTTINRAAKRFTYQVECFNRKTGRGFTTFIDAANVEDAIKKVKRNKLFIKGYLATEGHAVINAMIKRSL